MSQYQKHVFVCTQGAWCPKDGDAAMVHTILKKGVVAAGLSEGVRVNHSGCLNQCGHGPMVVVYPEAVWYSAVDEAGAHAILREHLMSDQPAEAWRYRKPPGSHKLPRDEEGRPGRTSEA